MKLTVLGNQGPFPGPGGATSGYLLVSDKAKILIDCGSGVSSNLQKVCDPEDLDAIILTHFHADHYVDMQVFKHYIIQSRSRKGEIPKENIDVYCPASPDSKLQTIDKKAFNINIINENIKLTIKDCSISFTLTEHPVECYALSIESSNKKLVYTADSVYTNRLVEFSKKADILVADSNFTSNQGQDTKLPHMSARQNAQLAHEAAVKKLLLTHFYPHDDISQNLKEAKEIFENTENTEIFKSYEV